MGKIFKIVNKEYALAFTLLFAFPCTSVLKGMVVDEDSSKTSYHFFVYPSNVVEYSISGSPLIGFNLSSNGEVKNLHIIDSLGIPFDESIINDLGHYVSKKIISASNNFNSQYRLEVKFEN